MKNSTPTENPPIDPAAIRAHVQMVHAMASGIDGQLVVASYGEHPETGAAIPHKVRRFDVGDIDGMCSAIGSLTREEHRNVYLPLHVVRRGLNGRQRGGAHDIVAVLGLVADFDDPEASEYRDRCPLPADLVLETSAGRFQCFYIFDQPAKVDEVRDTAIKLKEHCQCDHGTADLAHVWRIPGTLNWPNAKKFVGGRPQAPQLVEAVELWSGTTTPLAKLKLALNQTAQQDRTTPLRIATQSDADLIAMASRARNGSKFSSLMRGEWCGHASQSEADQALCSTLAFWTAKDAEQMDRIFRQSGLMREKWDERHSSDGSTYGNMTIATAIQACSEVYRPAQRKPHDSYSAQDKAKRATGLAIQDWQALSTRQFQPIPAVVEDLILPGLSMLSGRPKQGKSWLVHGWLLRVAAGRAIFGLKTHRAKCLYLALEDSERRLQDRTRKLLASYNMTDADINGHFLFTTQAARLGEGLEEQLSGAADDAGVRLIVIDVLACVRQERPSNQSIYAHDYEVGQRLKSITASRPELSIILVHHNNKSGLDALDAVSGTHGLAGGMDNVFSLIQGSSGMELHVNGRDIENSAPIPMVKGEDGMWTLASRDDAWRTSVSDTRGQIMDALKAGCETPRDIILHTGIPKGPVEQQLYRLIKAGDVIKPTRGTYKPTPPVCFQGAWRDE